ncbi:MAG: DNA repair protein RecO, partial [Bacillota bacterium]|nr:DNA repair protein RecO [Bacillota bacterium]
MYLKTKAIIIKIRDFSENDLLIDLFTLKEGKITVIAKGAKNAKSKISVASNLFVYGEFDLFIGKKWNRINSLEIINSFYYIREDIEKLSYGSYFLELIQSTIVEKKSEKDLFVLLLKTLDYLQFDKYIFLKVLFEFKLLCILGYTPELHNCTKCGGDLNNNISFSVYHGGVLCQKCKSDKSLNISEKILRIFRYFQQNEFYAILNIEINDLFIKKMDIILHK